MKLCRSHGVKVSSVSAAPAAMALDEKIRAAGGQTALLMTWSPKNGASIFSLEDVQSVLTENLITVSQVVGVSVAVAHKQNPGGFARCRFWRF